MLTRDTSHKIPGCIVVQTLEDALEKARELGSTEVFIGGGSEIYALAIPYADRLLLTIVDDQKEADSFFPDYSAFAKKTHEEHHEYEGLKYSFVTLERA